ncbi:MAG: YhgE/Pip domain-containing protein [Adlercreutzia sp.]
MNQDAGGSSELTGELNVGERIVDQLHENDQLHWEFTDYDAAMNELKSGRAYAAYVIPEHFTADLLTLTTGDFTQPKIEYYVNEKSGPVAPKITDTGATTLDETINSTFVATVSDVVVKTIDEKVNEGRENTRRCSRRPREDIGGRRRHRQVRRVLADLGDASKAGQAAWPKTLSKSAGIDAADESLGQMKTRRPCRSERLLRLRAAARHRRSRRRHPGVERRRPTAARSLPPRRGPRAFRRRCQEAPPCGKPAGTLRARGGSFRRSSERAPGAPTPG